MPNTNILSDTTSELSECDSIASVEEKKSPRKPKLKTEVTALSTFEAQPTKEGLARTKTEIVLKKLRGAKGASIDQLVQITGWQAHSVRGFLSGTVKTKLGLAVTSESGKDGVRRYRIEDAAKAG